MLGHIVSQRGIKVNLDKVKVIREMLTPKTEKEIQGFLGKLQIIGIFIARLTEVYELIFKLLRKDQPVVWNK